jgi:hypothetical protein
MKEKGSKETNGLNKTIKRIDRFVGSDVLIAMVMKKSAFWDITLCSPLKVNGRFGGTVRLHLQR